MNLNKCLCTLYIICVCVSVCTCINVCVCVLYWIDACLYTQVVCWFCFICHQILCACVCVCVSHVTIVYVRLYVHIHTGFVVYEYTTDTNEPTDFLQWEQSVINAYLADYRVSRRSKRILQTYSLSHKLIAPAITSSNKASHNHSYSEQF